MHRMPPSSRVVLAALLCLATRAGGAQATPTPVPRDLADALSAVPVGATIRLKTRDLPLYGLAGAMLGHVPGGVRLLVHGEPREVSLAEIRLVERHAGRRDAGEAFGRGAFRGFAVGAVIGTVATLAVWQKERRHGCGDCFISGTAVMGAASVLLTAVTTSVGGFVGLGYRDRWERVWPPER